MSIKLINIYTNYNDAYFKSLQLINESELK